ncbi:MFS transporter [Bacillus sp. B1-b2]|uniref:MFS transporter n=1 Tax=Bacillus sp. B1-b2 TaxID=2653201 RepID=UPI001261D97A|nr:MFS transporter [Bacillus sp. B1-b2]KAB7669328.1 MFS transporter [Bacillus sp. B1-b2]
MEPIKQEQRLEKKGLALYFTLPIISWALYDAANTIFSSNINTIFFPLYLQEVVGTNETQNQIASTFISYANSVASLFLVLFSPLFGVIMDRTGKKKKYIIILTLLTVIGTIAMGLSANLEDSGSLFGIPLSLALVILFFVLSKFTYHSSLVFYDTMISDLGNKEQIPLISGFGVAVGYIGTLIGLTVYLFIDDGQYQQSFIPTGILFLLLSLPLFFFIKDTPKQVVEKQSILSGYKEIIETFKQLKKYRKIFTFMIAYFFLNDAIATTVAMMSVYAKAIVGFSTGQFISLYLVSTISSIIGSFVFGYITKNRGAYLSIRYVGILMVVALIIGTIAWSQALFWVAGSLFGIALGSMWVTTRTYIVEITPEDKRGQFFGLFAFSGKVSSIIGPLLYGSITLIFADLGNIASRMALGSLIILTIIGLIVHARIKEE